MNDNDGITWPRVRTTLIAFVIFLAGVVVLIGVSDSDTVHAQTEKPIVVDSKIVSVSSDPITERKRISRKFECPRCINLKIVYEQIPPDIISAQIKTNNLTYNPVAVYAEAFAFVSTRYQIIETRSIDRSGTTLGFIFRVDKK